MIGYGAQLNPEERAAVIGFLTDRNRASAGEPSTPLDGASLLAVRCTVCHTRARIDDEDGDWEDWTEIVLRMQSYGAQLTDQEQQTLIAYLVATHGDHDDDDDDGGKGRGRGRGGDDNRDDDDRDDDRDDD